MELRLTKPLPRSPGSSDGRASPLTPGPLPPRPSRSATNLASAHPPQDAGFIDDSGSLPVNFVVDEPPSPEALAIRPPKEEIRRVQSSSDLAQASTQDAKTPKDHSKWKAALGEAQYFAGGLISRPADSTRHFSIIRHSRALIWYRGPSTSVSVTILSDAPLPADRRVWLQQKGYSGNVGMSLKALVGTTSNWIDVTPVTRAGPENVSAVDERGMQRDMKRFAKKASGKLKKHIPRETHVVRIPAVTTDGYFRLVLCSGKDGKKVLCGSPVFRVASTSADPSKIRGASLRTMPLEAGVRLASTIGQDVAKVYAGAAGAAVQSQATRLIPSTVMSAGQIAYGAGGSSLSSSVSDKWNNGKAGRYDQIMGDAMLEMPVAVVGADAGPESPFPFKFQGKVVKGSGKSTAEFAIPTANLREVPDTLKMRMRGVYAAWACVLPMPGLEDISFDWIEAVVTIAPLRNAAPEVVMKNRVAVHLIQDFDEATFFDAKMKVLLMGYLHKPAQEIEPGELLSEHARDVMVTLASLARDNWGPHDALTRMDTLRSERSFSQRMTEATGKVQQGVDQIPLHKLGVRSESATMRDVVYGNGGLFIPR